MDEHNILISVFLLLLFTLPQSQSQPQPGHDYLDCKEKPYNCGNLSNIFYPFWGQNRSASCGGGSLFNLHCSEDNATTILIDSQNFTVLRINQSAYTMKMMRTDLADDACSPQFDDTYLKPPLFEYAEHMKNVIIFYNCSSSVYPDGYNFECEHNPYNIYHATEGEGLEDLLRKFQPLHSCGRHIQVPSDGASPFGGVGVGDLQAGLRHGFTVSYHVDADCARCLGSEGYCGTDDFEKHLPSCYNCPDGSRALNCPGSVAHNHKSKLNLPRKITIGVASAVFGALVVSIACYVWYRRKKNSYAMSYMQSRSLSFDPSLKDTEKGSLNIAPGVHLFSYTELEEATNYFDASRELGEGGFGTVYFGKLPDGRCVAVKRLYENNYRRVEQFMNEIMILARLIHPNLVTLYGCTSRHGRELLLVYEYIPNGTVADHLHGERTKPGTLPWHIRMNIAVETASALKYLHVSDIIHRDVKTNNILLDSHFRVKVADFGLSRLFPNDVTHISTAPQGTPGYVDPEYHECYQLTSKSDVYSFGVVLIELISSLPAVDITRHRHEINLAHMAINKIHNQALHELVDPTLGFESDEKVRKMINAVAELGFQCLQSSKDMRPSMEEVLDTLKDIQSGGKRKSQPEVMDISSSAADDVVLLKDDPPPPSPDSNAVSKSTTPNASG